MDEGQENRRSCLHYLTHAWVASRASAETGKAPGQGAVVSSDFSSSGEQ